MERCLSGIQCDTLDCRIPRVRGTDGTDERTMPTCDCYGLHIVVFMKETDSEETIDRGSKM